jgi:hypothetical protein
MAASMKMGWLGSAVTLNFPMMLFTGTMPRGSLSRKFVGFDLRAILFQAPGRSGLRFSDDRATPAFAPESGNLRGVFVSLLRIECFVQAKLERSTQALRKAMWSISA